MGEITIKENDLAKRRKRLVQEREIAGGIQDAGTSGGLVSAGSLDRPVSQVGGR